MARMTKEEREQLKAERDQVLDTLAKLSGSKLTDDQVKREGTQLVLPASMTPAFAIEFLQDYIESQDTATSFNRVFNYRPWDGAAAVQRALLRVTGSTGIAKASFSFFGKQPPELKTIQIGFGQTMQVPWGRISVPMLEGVMTIAGIGSTDLGPVTYVDFEAPRKYKAHIEGLFNVIEEELSRGSIYKGQAIDGQTEPGFIDLAGVKAETVIYSDDTTVQLEANIWSVLRHTERMRELELPRKRAILLEGPYGTGKTLAAFLTAQIATENDWTFLYCRPARDGFAEVMSTARIYQPAVVFFEDVDAMTTPDASRDAISQLLDLFDGITAKGTEIMVVLTTNHPERIHRGMIRPGRLDAVVHIGALDQHGIERMINVNVPSELRDELDYEAIHEAMEGFLPAFAKEAIDRTMRYAIARHGGEVGVLTTGDFVQAARGLRPQLELMQGAPEGAARDTLSLALRREVVKAVDGAILLDRDDDHVLTLETNGVG